MTTILIAIIRGYQRFISPLFSAHCRFIPSCSDYAIDTIQQHGVIVGTRIALKRILRCHPLTKPHNQFLYDPPPPNTTDNKKP